jgi:uncharacterized protein (DUF433 family)
VEFPEWVEARVDVMMGKPRLKGTRIPVYSILEKLAAGETTEIVLAAYPQLKPEHIKASLEYAARLAADEIVLARLKANLADEDPSRQDQLVDEFRDLILGR